MKTPWFVGCIEFERYHQPLERRDVHSVVQNFSIERKGMSLGEEAGLDITADVGYGNQPHQGYCAVVPAGSDLYLEVALMKIVRNGKVRQTIERFAWCLTVDK